MNHNEPIPRRKVYDDKDFVLWNDGALFYYNGANCGTLYKEVDGYYHWSPPLQFSGCWNAANLRKIADILDDLNRDWDKEVEEGLKTS